MKRNNTEQVGEVLRRLLRQEGLETPLNEYRLVDAWKDVVGKLLLVIRLIYTLRIKYFSYICLHPFSVRS